MKRSDKFTKGSRLEAFRSPDTLSKAAREKAKLEDITFSQLMRRALRKELKLEITEAMEITAAAK